VEKLGSSHRSTRSYSTAVDEVRWIHDHLRRFEDGLHGDLSRFAAVPWLQLQVFADGSLVAEHLDGADARLGSTCPPDLRLT